MFGFVFSSTSRYGIRIFQRIYGCFSIKSTKRFEVNVKPNINLHFDLDIKKDPRPKAGVFFSGFVPSP
jgi:hypothetical protein